jgi:predicted SAM-dependent methyltransferase
MRLHLGCGKKLWPGWVNVDGNAPADVIHDLSKPLPYEDKTAKEIHCIHLFEHFYPHQVDDVLADWFRVLRPGGRLVMEMPDFVKACRNTIEAIDKGEIPSDKYCMWPLFSNNPDGCQYHDHKWGWTYQTLKPVMEKAGFINVVEDNPQHKGRKINRDFRISGVKL